MQTATVFGPAIYALAWKPPRPPTLKSVLNSKPKRLETLPKERIFPGSALLPSEGEIYDALLQENLASDRRPTAALAARYKATAHAMEAKRLVGKHHPAEPGRADSIKHNQELRNVQAAVERLGAMLKDRVSSAPQIQQGVIDKIKEGLERKFRDNLLLKNRNRQLRATNANLMRAFRQRQSDAASTIVPPTVTTERTLAAPSAASPMSPDLQEIMRLTALEAVYQERGRRGDAGEAIAIQRSALDRRRRRRRQGTSQRGTSERGTSQRGTSQRGTSSAAMPPPRDAPPRDARQQRTPIGAVPSSSSRGGIALTPRR